MHDRHFEFYFAHKTGDGVSPVALETERFILLIECADGDVYELSVWTEAYLTRLRTLDRESGERLGSQYFIPPDLVVARYDVDLIERIVAELIQTNRLREAWRIPDECTAAWVDLGDLAGGVDEDKSDAAWPAAWVPGERDLCGCCHLHLADEASSVGTGLG
jgi:hypothetical protein